MRSIVLLPPQTECGKSKYKDAGDMHLPKPRIVGGDEPRRHELPYQVRLTNIN